MARPVTTYTAVERGIQKVTRTYDDGRVVVSHRIKYADSNGKIITRTIPGNVSKARASLAEARDEVNKGKHVVISKQDGRTTFKAVADHWLEHSTHLKESTLQSHRRVVNGQRLADLHDVRMKDLTHERMQRFQATLVHYAPATQRNVMWLVKAICEDAVHRGLLKSNPCAKLKRPKQRKRRVSIPSKSDVRALLDRLSSPTPPEGSMGWCLPQTKEEREAGVPAKVDPRWRLVVELAVFPGLRAGELRGLKVQDFNARARTITVCRNFPTNGVYEDSPKSDAGVRDVDDILPSLCERIEDYIEAVGLRPRDYLLGFKDKDGMSRPYAHMNFYRRVFKPACEELGIPGRFHDLRHFHASLCIADGMDLVRLAHRLGHATPSFTLNTYGHLIDKEPTGMGARLEAEWAPQTNVRPLRVVGEGARRKPEGGGRPPF
jgi:integrase